MTARGQGAVYFKRYGRGLILKLATSLIMKFGGVTAERLMLRDERKTQAISRDSTERVHQYFSNTTPSFTKGAWDLSNKNRFGGGEGGELLPRMKDHMPTSWSTFV